MALATHIKLLKVNGHCGYGHWDLVSRTTGRWTDLRHHVVIFYLIHIIALLERFAHPLTWSSMFQICRLLGDRFAQGRADYQPDSLVKHRLWSRGYSRRRTSCEGTFREAKNNMFRRRWCEDAFCCRSSGGLTDMG